MELSRYYIEKFTLSIEVINLKKILISILSALFITFTLSTNTLAFQIINSMKLTYTNPDIDSKYSLEEEYQDILYSMITPYIQKSVDDYYMRFSTPHYAYKILLIIIYSEKNLISETRNSI